MGAAHVTSISPEVLQTTPDCPVLSGHPPPFPPAISNDHQTQTGIHKPFPRAIAVPLETPRLVPAQHRGRGQERWGCSDVLSLGGGGVIGTIGLGQGYKTSSELRFVLFQPLSLGLLPRASPHGLIYGNEMSSWVSFEKSTNSLGNTGYLS